MTLEVIPNENGGHHYTFDGNRVPGVTEVLELNDVLLKNAFYQEHQEYAAIRGRDVHMATADLDRGMKNHWWKGDAELEPYVKAWEAFKKDFGFKPRLIEKPLFHETFRYAGQCDRYGECSDVGPVTLEIKGTSVIGPHVPLQLGGYNLLFEDWQDRTMVAVQLKPNGRYTPHWYKSSEGCRVFLAALTMALWKNTNHKLGMYK